MYKKMLELGRRDYMGRCIAAHFEGHKIQVVVNGEKRVFGQSDTLTITEEQALKGDWDYYKKGEEEK